jgi:hypothetical protein
MASAGKRKTTMAKLARESRLRERRMEKAARKRARKDAAGQPPEAVDAYGPEDFIEAPDSPPDGDSPA